MTSQATGLRYAVRLGVVAKYLSQLGLVLGVLCLLPSLVALLLTDYGHALAYVPVQLLLLLGWRLTRQLPVPAEVQVNEGLVIVALTFLLTPLLLCLPLMQSGLSWSAALFEAISALTTTGLTSLPADAARPAAFLFSRAWMQWYGGLGIVVLSLALVIAPGIQAKGLAVADIESDNLPGNIRGHARRILFIYLLLTGGAVLLNLLAGVSVFDGLLFGLSAVSTGGFAPTDGSLMGLAWPAQWAISLGCLAGAVPLALYGNQGHQEANRLQLFCLLALIGSLALLLTYRLHQDMGLSWQQAAHHGPLLALSAQTTAGFSSLAPDGLSNGSKALLILAMLVGGGMASTAGGIKLLRLLIAWQALRHHLIRSALSRHAVLEPTLAGQRLSEEEIQAALLLILLFGALVLCSWLPFLLLGYPPLDALFEVVSASGTVGLSVGLSQADLPGLLRGILMLDMLMGRLEILAWLVLLYPGSWFGRRKEVT